MSICNHIYKLIPEHRYVIVQMAELFGVVTLKHTYFLFGPTKHAKHFENMAELIYAELTEGRESTRLTHTHKFTSLKNVVISA